PAPYAYGLNAHFTAAISYAFDDGIQAGYVAPASEDANSLGCHKNEGLTTTRSTLYYTWPLKHAGRYGVSYYGNGISTRRGDMDPDSRLGRFAGHFPQRRFAGACTPLPELPSRG